MAEIALRTAHPTPLASLLSPLTLAETLWQSRDLIRQFTIRLFLQRYRGTQLGVLWSVIFPLTLLGVYTFVFSTVFKGSQWPGLENQGVFGFAVALLCGMVTYGVFSESTSRSTGLVVDHPNFVKKVVFPLEILAVASLGSSLLYGTVGLGLVVIGAAIIGKLTWTALLFPVVLLPLVVLSLGASWFLSSLGVFLRDIGNVVGILVTQVLFFLTPVLYSKEHLGQFGWVADLNPLASVIDGARRVILLGTMPDWRALAISMVVAIIVLQCGFAFFMKSKRGFGDVM